VNSKALIYLFNIFVRWFHNKNSQVSIETITSGNVPSGSMTERSASSRKVFFGSKVVTPRILQVVVVRMLMVSLKSTKALRKEPPFIYTVTMGFPGSSYFTGVSFPSNKLDKVSTTWTIGVIFVFLRLIYTQFFNSFGIYWNVLNSLEEGYFYTNILEFTQKIRVGVFNWARYRQYFCEWWGSSYDLFGSLLPDYTSPHWPSIVKGFFGCGSSGSDFYPCLE